jgi:serine/threonine-protein kinase
MSPVANTRVALGASVTITVVSPQVNVPDTIGLSLTRAEQRLALSGLTAVVVQKASDVAAGTVISQSPGSGRISRGSSVTLVVAGPATPPTGGSSPGPTSPAATPPQSTPPVTTPPVASSP